MILVLNFISDNANFTVYNGTVLVGQGETVQPFFNMSSESAFIGYAASFELYPPTF